MNTIDILTKWIRIAKQRGMTERVQQFWLLRDYAECEIWSDEFLRAHAQEAWEILVGLDDNKPEVEIVVSELLPVVKEYMV